MPARLFNFVLATCIVLIPTISLLRGLIGVDKLLNSVLVTTGIVGVTLVLTYKVHLTLIAAVLALSASIPTFITARPMPLAVPMAFVLCGGGIARMLMGRKTISPTNRVMDIAVGIGATLTVAWILVSPPGIASAGSEVGGAWEAVYAVAGICAYWGIRSLRDIDAPWSGMVGTGLVMAPIGFFLTILFAILGGNDYFYGIAKCFFEHGWLFYGLIFGWLIKLRRDQYHRVIFPQMLVLCMILTIHAVISGTRSRIAYAPAMIGSCLWIAKMHVRMLLGVLLFLVVCSVLANSDGYYSITPRGRRVLSVLRVQPTAFSDSDLGELGRSSPWRKSVWQTGWTKVKEKPWLGHGYRISSSELADITSAISQYTATQRGIIAAGQFHNLVLNQMYFWGIPASLVFTMAWLTSVMLLLKQSCRAKGSFGVFCVGLMVLFVGVSGQLIINGTGENFLTLCILMGCVQAFSARDDHGRPMKESILQHPENSAGRGGDTEPVPGEAGL